MENRTFLLFKACLIVFAKHTVPVDTAKRKDALHPGLEYLTKSYLEQSNFDVLQIFVLVGRLVSLFLQTIL